MFCMWEIFSDNFDETLKKCSKFSKMCVIYCKIQQSVYYNKILYNLEILE